MNTFSRNAAILVTGVVAIGIILLIFLSSIPYTFVSTKGIIKQNIKTLFPEGWSFFTISPQLEKDIFYKISAGELVEVNFKNSSAENVFGISRYCRLKHIESSIIINQIDSSSWVQCATKNDFNTVKDTISTIYVFNSTNIGSMEGDYLIKKSKPIPYAWVKSADNLFMPCKIVKIHVYKKH